MKYDIWMEGYVTQGSSNTAQKIATGIEADSFIEACRKFAKSDESKQYGEYDEKNNRVFGCCLFDQELKARMFVG